MSVAAQSPAPYYRRLARPLRAGRQDRRRRFRRGLRGLRPHARASPSRSRSSPTGARSAPRIVREVEAAAALDHPNIVALYDWFADGEGSILVWELVRGDSLDELGHELGDGDVVAVGVELLDALAYAHSQGIVHRDVKPQNVMLDDEGHVKVMDFGIAHLMDSDTLTGDGDVIGTIAYMSPEQAAGRRVRPPSDVYSAGMVLYELLAGAHPLRGGHARPRPSPTSSPRGCRRSPRCGRTCRTSSSRWSTRPARRARPSGRRAAYLSEAFDDLSRSGSLQSRRLRTAQRLVRPLGRAAEVAERAGGAALAAVDQRRRPRRAARLPAELDAAAGRRSAPPSGRWCPRPASRSCSARWRSRCSTSRSAWAARIWPSPWSLFLVARARPIVALWPAFALVLTPAYLTLLAPAAAALLGRVRGPLTAAWAGVGTVLFLLLTRAPRGAVHARAAALARRRRRRRGRRPAHRRRPRARARGRGADAAAGRRLGGAGGGAGLRARRAAASRRVSGSGPSRSRPCSPSTASSRWSCGTTRRACGRSCGVWPLPAAVILLPLVLTTGEAPEEGDDGDLQEGE